nr:ribonuclease H-like domain, reverse transcriptase, RNA-dependent DNA polymerase [Tanacetum cinerariifolium]
MGHEKPPPQLKFYMAFFSSQWKFLIHTFLQSLSAKRTAWNEFSSVMASAVICLATGRKFNFSKYIFDSTEEIWKRFYGNETPLFATMLVQPQPQVDEGIEMPIAKEQPSTTSAPSTSQPPNQPSTPHDSHQPSQPPTSYDSPLTGVHIPESDEGGCIQTGRMIAEMDADAEISLVDETKGRNDENDDNIMFNVGALDDGEVLVKTAKTMVDTAVVDETMAEVGADEPAVTIVNTPVTTGGVTIFVAEPIITTTTDFSEVDMTLAKALAELKTSKPKVVTTAAVSTTTTVTIDVSRPEANGITIQEYVMQATTPIIYSLKDKGKAKMAKPERPMKRKDQIDHDAKVARIMQEQWQAQVDEEERLRKEREEEASMAAIAELYDEVQAQMDVDHELATRMTYEEQEKYTVEERSKMLAEFFENGKKQLAVEREEAIRNKPPIKSYLRNLMMTYLKHTGRAAGSSTKQMSPTKQKENDQEFIDSDKELRECLKVVQNDDKAIDYETLDVKSPIVDYESQLLTVIEAGDVHVYKLIRLNGSFRQFLTFSGMLEVLDRPDVLDLHKLKIVLLKNLRNTVKRSYYCQLSITTAGSRLVLLVKVCAVAKVLKDLLQVISTTRVNESMKLIK